MELLESARDQRFGSPAAADDPHLKTKTFLLFLSRKSSFLLGITAK